MTIQETIEQKIVDAIPLLGLDVINESHMHNVPAGSSLILRWLSFRMTSRASVCSAISGSIKSSLMSWRGTSMPFLFKR